MQVSRAALLTVCSHRANPVLSVEMLFKFARMVREKVRRFQLLFKDTLGCTGNGFNTFIARVDSIFCNCA